MRPLLVVVRHEFTQDGHKVLLVQNDDVVETLSPQGADHSLRNGVRLWRVDRGGDLKVSVGTVRRSAAHRW